MRGNVVRCVDRRRRNRYSSLVPLRLELIVRTRSLAYRARYQTEYFEGCQAKGVGVVVVCQEQ